jgi:hypothetical protein
MGECMIMSEYVKLQKLINEFSNGWKMKV